MSGRLTSEEQLVTAKDLAPRYGLAPSTITLWARQGRIPCRRLSRKSIRFSIHDVDAALPAVTTASKPEIAQAVTGAEAAGKE
jgi:hypothetical protein